MKKLSYLGVRVLVGAAVICWSTVALSVDMRCVLFPLTCLKSTSNGVPAHAPTPPPSNHPTKVQLHKQN